MRIAIGRIAQESNALSPVVSTLADFSTCQLVEGDALVAACAPHAMEMPGFLRDAELSGAVAALRAAGDVEIVPTLAAWAIPGGPVARATLDELQGRLCARLRAAGPLDAVLLSLHGAMVAEDSVEPEAELLAAVREAVGPEARIAVTLDLHAWLTPAKLRHIDVVAAYHTNPHRDHATTGRRAATVLLDVLRRRVRLTTAWRSLPMVMGGGLTLDFLPPMAPIFWRCKRLERDKGPVLLANLFMSHLWLDAPELGWAVHVTSDGDQAAAEAAADEIADRLWRVRTALPPKLPDPLEAIAEARGARWARRAGLVVMCDASDVVGAGAPGDRIALVRAAYEHGSDLRWRMPLRDPRALDVLAGHRVGDQVSLALGGALDAARSQPLAVEARLLYQGRHPVLGRRAAISFGSIQLVVTDGPPLAMQPSFYQDCGLTLRDADVAVVKSFFPFRLYFAAWNRKSIYVRCGGGTTDFDVWRDLRFARPTWPQAAPADWRPADAARRGVPLPVR